MTNFRALRRADGVKSKMVMSAASPGRSTPRSVRPKNWAGSEVIRFTACSSESACFSRTNVAQQIAWIPRVAQHIDVGATIGDADQRAWVTEFSSPRALRRCRAAGSYSRSTRSSSSARSKNASSGATPRSRAISAMLFHSADFSAGLVTSLTLVRSQMSMKDSATFEFRGKRAPKLRARVDLPFAPQRFCLQIPASSSSCLRTGTDSAG